MFHTTFTSESVCAGHPDKICDQISDAIVDAALAQDPNAHVAVETLVTENRVALAEEVTTSAPMDYEAIARSTIKNLGYTNPHLRFTAASPIDIHIHTQSPEIAVGVNDDGAGDQGMMFGYACNETENYMPQAIEIAHRLAQAIDRTRTTHTLAYLRPDGKSQVTVRYEKGKPVGIETVVLAVPHDENMQLKQVKHDLLKTVVLPTLEKYGYAVSDKQLIVNGTGVWHIGGPASDTGVTGRKIIVDTYGGYARAGGGAFSGKDPTKVDRSGAYAARYLAKNIVANNLADRAEVRLAYCIGTKKPVMQEVETFGTLHSSAKTLREFMSEFLDTSVKGILDSLQLRQPIYLPTAAYGHFGRPEFPWEKVSMR